ncbi:MAG: FadR/GntR family transcriptional regulator [Chloroflexota bacterium]
MAVAQVRRRKVSVDGFSRVEASGGSLVDEVADQIRRRIEEGELAEGTRLPSERDLAEELGISRTVLRESLRSLESLGYVEARVGQGRFVVDPRTAFRSRQLIDDWLRRNQSALHDLIELRAAVESQALRGGRGDPALLAEQARALIEAQAAAVADGRPDDAAETDTAFHLLLAGGSPNVPLSALADALIGRARTAARAAYRGGTYERASIRQHRAIVAALAAGDRGRAADLLFEHHLSRADQLASYLEREEEGSAD